VNAGGRATRVLGHLLSAFKEAPGIITGVTAVLTLLIATGGYTFKGCSEALKQKPATTQQTTP
jgi:putative intracellular protease/amidase